MNSNPNRSLVMACTVMAMALAAQASQDRGWSRLTEGQLSVYTQGDPAQAATLIHTFAQLKDAMSQASVFHPDANANLKIIDFESAKDFNLYRLNAGSCAFYQQTGRAEYIVLEAMNGSNRDVTFHEFNHFVFAHSHVKLPLWLNEGLADFYSTFKISGDTVTFGGAVNGRLPILHSNAWLPLNNLFNISTSSTYYSNPEQMALFYSESWALAHMLVVSPNYSTGFPAFIRALNDGHSAAEGLQLVYHKTPDEIQQDLHAYVDHRLATIQSHLTPVPASTASSALAPISSAEMDLTFADLTLTNPNTRASLQNRLAAAGGQLPESAEIEESLGYVALRQGKSAEARTHFQAAVDRHSSDPNVLFYLAHLDREAGEPSSKTIPLLEQALSIKPDLGDARLELALAAAAEGDFAKALEALQKLTSPRPENAYAAAYTEAYCYANTDKLTEARAALSRAKALAANDHDRAEVGQLLEFINQQS